MQAPRVWNTLQINRDARLRRARDALGNQLEGKALPADRVADLLHAVLECGDRVCLEGNNQKQADFLAQALAQQGPGPAQSLDRLSTRDLEILRLLAAGRSLSEIADALGLGYKTIANTLSLIKTKLGVARTSDLVRLALEAGIT